MTRLTDERIDRLIDAMPERPGRFALREFTRAIEAELARQAERVACVECGGALQWRCPACRIAQSVAVAEAPLPSAPDTVQERGHMHVFVLDGQIGVCKICGERRAAPKSTP